MMRNSIRKNIYGNKYIIYNNFIFFFFKKVLWLTELLTVCRRFSAVEFKQNFILYTIQHTRGSNVHYVSIMVYDRFVVHNDIIHFNNFNILFMLFWNCKGITYVPVRDFRNLWTF